eukprot:494944-Amphidinium_carterae.1
MWQQRLQALAGAVQAAVAAGPARTAERRTWIDVQELGRPQQLCRWGCRPVVPDNSCTVLMRRILRPCDGSTARDLKPGGRPLTAGTVRGLFKIA